jgi:acyl dehydratase
MMRRMLRVGVGDVYLGTPRTFTCADLDTFSTLTGDHNPIHSSSSSTATRLVHGSLVASLIPATFAAHFPGSLYLTQSLQFTGRVFTGDTLVTRITVTRVTGRMLECRTDIVTLRDECVIQGTAQVLTPPRNRLVVVDECEDQTVPVQ